ncbi:P27 family phage terminase small subunit [Anaeroglobus geminatus]|uniref:Phage terminase, small subunit, P27 family n=1 Tax=Anaeroglobus geminatus F0357 TaxID=861450 RepID=G9YK32_9FIRM|nr:P27 family phage terminase small subunit [Anaeroglobus geminatus]EHM37857.1 phage terminase, small subunit, P27 family [Anaeroglobus geminatus F0357]
MAGRPAKPIELHLLNGNKRHLTKVEIEQRKKSEVQLGEHKLVCPPYVRHDKNAYKKWKEIAKLYKDIDFVSSADVGLMARYCMAFSEYINLTEHRKVCATIRVDTENGEDTDMLEVLAAKYPVKTAAKMFEKIEYVFSLSGVLAVDKALNAKMTTLVQMEDRLFLNPLAKIRNVPKKEVKQDDPLKDKGFGNI